MNHKENTPICGYFIYNPFIDLKAVLFNIFQRGSFKFLNTDFMQRRLLHQLEGRRINLAVLEVHLFVQLLLLPLGNLQPKWWHDSMLENNKSENLKVYPITVAFTSDGVMQSSTSGDS